MPDAMPVAKFSKLLNRFNAAEFKAFAIKGEGAFESIKRAIGLVVNRVTKLI